MAAEKKVKAQVYDAQGSKVMKEADDETAGFKKGGKPKMPRRKRAPMETKAEEHHEEEKKKGEHKKLKSGGVAEGHRPHMRMDKPSRSKHAAGGSPYSSGKKMSPEADGMGAAGHESERPKSPEGD